MCCSLRFLARIRTFKKLLVDDYFVLLALVFVFANAIIWQIYAGNMYYVVSVAAGLKIPGNDFAQLAESYFKSTAAVMVLFYSALWSIKISFLLLFKRLGTNVRGQKRIWWPVFGITLATYFACIGPIQYRCDVHSLEYVAIHCSGTASKTFQKITLKLNCAWDVITDCLSRSMSLSKCRADWWQSCSYHSVCSRACRWTGAGKPPSAVFSLLSLLPWCSQLSVQLLSIQPNQLSSTFLG